MHKVYSIRHLCFTAADAAHTCNGNVLVGDEHREKDTSVHDVERHDSTACNLSMGTAMDGYLVSEGNTVKGRRDLRGAEADAVPERFGERLRLRRSSSRDWSVLHSERRVRCDFTVAG